MSVHFRNIVGNTELTERISREICDRTLSHAYLIEGPRGSGRHNLAYNIAAAISCSSQDTAPCCKCKSCEKIFSGASPDIMLIGLEDGKTTIGVEAIRSIRDDMSTSPNDLDIKVYIIEDADRMTLQAQNAFLLSLEEPPEYVLFFLICENSNSLLETVRSRAPVLRLKRLDDTDLKAYILSHDKRAVQLQTDDEDAFETLVFISNGCMGKALSLLDTKERKNHFDKRSAAERIVSLMSSQNRAAVLEIISELGTKRSDVTGYLTSVQYAVRDLLLLKKTDSAPLCFYRDRSSAQEISTRYTSSTLISMYDALCDAISELEANSNVRLTLLNMVKKAGLI